MEFLFDQQFDFYSAWYNHYSDVREGLEASGWNVVPDIENGFRVGSRDCSRLRFLAQLRHIAGGVVYMQQLAFPVLATVL